MPNYSKTGRCVLFWIGYPSVDKFTTTYKQSFFVQIQILRHSLSYIDKKYLQLIEKLIRVKNVFVVAIQKLEVKWSVFLNKMVV
jgi:hypothetical protein